MQNIGLNKIKADISLALLLCLFIFALGYAGLDNNCNWGDDFAAYMADGIAMAQGRYDEQLKLNVILRSGRLVGLEDEHVHAWGFPLVHALVYRFSGFETQNFSQLWLYKLPSLVAFSIMAGIFYLFLRRRLGAGISVLLTIALCAHNEFFYAIRNLYNDIFFMALSVISFFLAEIFIGQTKAKAKVLCGLALGFMLWCCYSVRLNGIVSVVCVLLLQLFSSIRKKKLPSLSDLIHVAFFALLTLVFNFCLFPSPTSTSSAGDISIASFLLGCGYYFDQLIQWAKHFISICFDIPVNLAATFFYSVFDSQQLNTIVSNAKNLIYNDVYTVLAVLLLLSALGGMLAGLKKDTHIVFFIIVSFVGTAALSLGQELRYLYALLPYLLMYSALGVQYILSLLKEKRSPRRPSRLFTTALLAILCIFAVIPAVESSIENQKNDVQENLTAYSSAAIEAYNYIQDNTAADETIAFFKPRALYLNTGRVSLLPEKGGFSVADADYYLHYVPMESFYIPEGQEADFQPIFENYEFILYKNVK